MIIASGVRHRTLSQQINAAPQGACKRAPYKPFGRATWGIIGVDYCHSGNSCKCADFAH
ncbi:hypothetical protein SV7mr_13240 [Stieleria bergensis]|uniref:Uncharacterized protein n=1 Tax=Stieleria bergensis TaxID=2528025 RepID=A0A517SRV7_9BACT|nr:hypothetical protein SV7mr_13240 [Planctomycetes bacterium SV_7m_r]